GTGLLSVSAGGGDAKVLTKPEGSRGVDHFFPSVLPGNQAVLFTYASALGGASGLESFEIGVLDRRTGRQKVLVQGGSQAEYIDPGYLVYAVSGTLRAVRFDLERLEVIGDAAPVLDQLMMTSSTLAANYAISRNGTLVFVPGNAAGAARSLVWVDRQGR